MRISEHKKRTCRRIISMLLVVVLVLGYFPLELVPEKVKEDTGIVVKTVHAATDPTELAGYIAEYDTSNSWGFVSGDGRLAQYSKCFEDNTFAQNHKNDTVTLASSGTGAFEFGSNYEPIGTESNPFEGTFIFNTSAGSFEVSVYDSIFNYVSDGVTLCDTNGTNIPIVISRAGNVGAEVSPLFAKHVKGSGLENPVNWLITLNASSAFSYSGVIYEMYNEAKINLTFTDNSNHTPGKDSDGNITSGSIIANNESNANYGILCGKLVGNSELTATYTYTDTTAVTFIGTETAYCGGLIGELNDSTFTLNSGSSNLNVTFETPKDEVGFICGHSEGGTINLPIDYGFEGTIDGNDYAGGIAGYCKNTIINYLSSTGTITLSDCNVKNGTTTGGVFGYYECDTYDNDILIDRTYSFTDCTVEGTGISGGIAGEYKPTYSHDITINLNNYTLGATIALNTGTSAGGLFGKYTAPGNVTINDSDTDTDFTSPTASVAYGGIIGEYVNGSYDNILTLSGFTVDGLNCSASGNVGGIIRVLTGSTYVSVDDVSVTNVTADASSCFGGIVSTLDSSNAGSFIDLTGDYTLSMASGKTYKGGAIAGSFKKGVIRFAGTTDISGAQAANGYAQLVYENDETLVYAKGSGSDGNWTLKRNSSTTASDLGQWGEVVRMFKVGEDYKNAEGAGIVSFANNKVTVAQGVKSITDTVTFAKCALNMQLNDGYDHGALCFEEKSTYKKSELLKANLTVSGTIDLKGTGLLGFMRDGGSAFSSNAECFTGSITKADGASSAEIDLASGELYGTYLEGQDGTGGKIYLAGTHGHNAQGMFAFAKGATATNVTVGGDVKVERKAGATTMYAGALFGATTNGASLSGVSINTTLDVTKADSDAFFFIGGAAGVFDGSTGSTDPYLLEIKDSCSIKPTIKLYGNINCTTKRTTNVGGILGSLKGETATKYGVSVASSEVSPTIEIGSSVANADDSYIGGMIGRIVANATNERSVTLNTVTMTGASVQTKSKNSGGLLGSYWERTNLTVDGLTITGSIVESKYSDSGSKQSGLVFQGTGKWDINTLTIEATSGSDSVNTVFKSTDTAPASFGLIVNEAYNGNDGLYINLQNSGYTLSGVTVPTSSTDGNYYVDEIAADTCSGDILVGGNGTGIVNINMNAANGTKTKITDISNDTENGTGTYQNQLYSQLGNLIGNRNSRYYYNLDVMMKTGHTKTDGEKFLLWSVNKYAASNISSNFEGAITDISAIDLSGLSYYPISGGSVELPTGATITFGFNAINAYENASHTVDGWSRNPDDVGDPNAADARNQHYLMQTGLFTTVTSLTANTLTLAGDFGYVEGVASGALINGSTSGSVSLTGLTLNGLKPSSTDSYMLINYINGTDVNARPTLTVNNLRATNYIVEGVTQPVARSLFGKAHGQNMTMNFKNIKLDARDGNTINDSNWSAAKNAASDMTAAYGTSRSIFNTATFFHELLAAKTSTMEYYYTVEEDWDYVDANDVTKGYKREVTYGKEVTSSKEYENGEKHYDISSGTGHFTNPISDCNTLFDFSSGFLPYVANYVDKGVNATYPVVEIKVNYKVAGLVEGCGTYNDPYIISTHEQLEMVADAINNNNLPGNIKLPNEYNADNVITSWHDESGKGDGLYNISGENYVKDSSNSTNGISSWNKTRVRYYLASAYYKITADLTGANSLSSGFEGIGIPGSAVNGNIVFHGVIVGEKSDGTAPTITNPTANPLIYISNGSVVKNLNIIVTAASITKSLDRCGDNALYGYKQNNSTQKGAEYYGGVIGEIMGGDNIIDDVTVKYTGTTTLSGTYKHLIAEGGMVGAVVNGALIFRGSNTVTNRNVTGGGIYSNAYVGRVINGYAVYESITGRNGTAPDNYNTLTGEGNNVTKTYTYPIDTIDRGNTNKLDVNYTSSGTGTITVPDAQSLYILSLITQSIASTANTDSNTQYGVYSPSYGYNGYVTGIARLGDYSSVGCGTSATKPTDYSDYAKFDSVNNYTNSSSKDGLMKAPIPYIIYRYTQRYDTTTTNPATDFPARRMTFDNSKFWDITLSSSDTFASFDSFKAFRGIGCVGINPYSLYGTVNATKTAFKVATFDGGGNTIKLYISLPRYERNQENYFHAQNKSLTQTYSGDDLHKANYGHDENLWQLMGMGLFDCVSVKNDSDHEYQFQDFTLQGTIEDKVYNTSGSVITGTTDQTQLFCVGGVVGKRVNGNNSDINFNKIIFDGFTITGAYSCGGLIGIDAIGKNGKTGDPNAKKMMKIVACNSETNGISITGGYYGKENNKIRHGIGSFVGMTFWCRPNIDGKTATSNTSDISVLNVSSFYTGNYMSAVGGLIGYSGSGAEIKNINLVAANSNAVIGGDKVSNAAGFIGFTQAMTEENKTNNRSTPTEADLKDCVYIENCTIQNLSIKAKDGAGGFVAKTGNSDTWHTKYIYISNSAVVGDADVKPEIKAYGTGTATQTNCVGGFVGDLRSSAVTCLIQNSYIENYKIEGYHVGGIIGETTYRSVNLKNLYVKNCEIIRNQNSSGAMGGIVGYSDQNINGYNLKIDNVVFKKKNGSNYVESPSDAGFILGANDKNNNIGRIDKFVGICAYHTTASKVPTAVVKDYGTNTGNFFIFADYLNASATDTASASHASTFNVVVNATSDQIATVDQPVAPFLTVNPRMAMGTGKYITGDGASYGKAGAIYKDAIGSSNRKYTINSTTTDPSFSSTDSDVLAEYITDAGDYKSGAFMISKASDVFDDFDDLDVGDFTMLVINDDSARKDDITPFIKSYIRLVTNAAVNPIASNNGDNTPIYSKYAFSCGNTSINDYYKIVIKPCYYDEDGGKFVLGTAGSQGLQLYSSDDTTNAGKYWFDSTKADSDSEHAYQFSLIDVQFKDPTDATKVAYHLYVPVYAKKMLAAKFSAVTLTSTSYSRGIYANKIASEITTGKSAGNPSLLVENSGEWTTTFIRYTYPKKQINSNANWNFEKKIQINLDQNFDTLPAGTKMILLDPNLNSDRFYIYTVPENIPKDTPYEINLSSFVNPNDNNNPFSPKDLKDIYVSSEASNSTGTELYEDYYISLYVPKDTGKTHGVLFGSGTEMSYTGDATDETQKANIESDLWSFVVLGDLFEHNITSFVVGPPSREITADNNTITTDVTATVRLTNSYAAPYLSYIDIAQSFFVTLTSHEDDGTISDGIRGTDDKNYITNNTTITYNNGTGDVTSTATEKKLGNNFVQLNTGSIKNALLSAGYPTVEIHSVSTISFMDISAFPYNLEPEPNDHIGTQVSIKSNLAYSTQLEDLLYSSMKKTKEDPAGTFYCTKTRNNADLNFSASADDDEADEIGLKTNNRSLLGVNGKYSTNPPIKGKSIYNANDILNYDRATAIVYKISLWKKVTDANGKTTYVQVGNIGDYLSNVTLTDKEVTLSPNTTNSSKYVYTGQIDHTNPKDKDKMFEADFECNVLTSKKEYANYKIMMEVELTDASNTYKSSYIIYTYAKFDPSVIDED